MKRGTLANARVSKILDMSRDFQAHRKNIVNIHNRSGEGRSLKKRAVKIQQLLEGKNRYYCNVQTLRLTELQRQNNKLVERLENIHQRDPRKLSKSNSNQTLGSIRLNRTSSAKSLNQSFRRSESRRIIRENGQLATRIVNAQPRPGFLLDKLKKEYTMEQQYVRSISRYSQKNRNMLTSIVQKGLKLKPKHTSFLPTIQNSQQLAGSSSRASRG